MKVMPTIVPHLPLNISENVRDRGLVPKDHQWEIAYGKSNGHVTPKGETGDADGQYAHISKTAGDAI